MPQTEPENEGPAASGTASAALHMQHLLPPPDKMIMTGDLAHNWEYFEDSWDNYVKATELKKRGEPVVVATLLSTLGKQCYLVYKNLPLSDRTKSQDILKALRDYFKPKTNIIYERYLFNSCVQEKNQTFDQFLNKLRELASTCEYDQLNDQLIRDRIVIGIQDGGLRGRLLRHADLTLAKAIDMCHSSEQAANHMSKIDKSDTVNYAARKGKSHPKNKKKQSEQSKGEQGRECKYCGERHLRGNCKAYGQECAKCRKKNHLAIVCRSSEAKKDQPKNKGHPKKTHKLHVVEEAQAIAEESDDSIYTISSGKAQYFVKVAVETPEDTEVNIEFQLDTGATCSTLTMKDYNKISSAPLKKSNAKLKLYDNTYIKPVGTVTLRCTTNNVTKRIHFEVVDRAPTSLLSGKACSALKLIQFSEHCLRHVVCATEENMSRTGLSKDSVLTEYSDVFKGLGKLPGLYHIETDPNVKPKQDNPRRVPVSLKAELKSKLESMVNDGVLAKVDKPTAWINSMVVVRKPNKLRICLDPSQTLNKAIIRNRYPTPTIEDVAPRLTKARVFSVADAKDGFTQVELDEPSSLLTTFWTPFGRYRWLRMPFGISSAPEEFQRRLDECLEGLQNIEVIHDDIVCYGSGDTDEEAVKSHDEAFKALLDRCRQKGVKLNKTKLKFKMPSVAYMGHVLSAEGLSPDPEKVKAVMDMPRPTDVQGVQRLLGVVNYLSKFAPQLSTMCEPLRRLTDKNSEFDWLPKHEEALDRVKQLITQAPVLQFYDSSKDVTIECDSSDVGLGAALLQNGHPVAYVSRALTQTERNYAQIEKECLAIVFATERFDHYILGKADVTVLSDHKPLEAIFKKPILTSPKRLQRMRLRLQKYSLKIHYKQGKTMYLSDTLSRAALPISQKESGMPQYVIFQIKQEESQRQELEDINEEDTVYVSDERLYKIRVETGKDTTLQTLMNVVKAGWPNEKPDVPLCIKEYWPYREELTTQNGLLYRGTRIIIPKSMRPEMIERAHAAHMGIQYTNSTAREIMYWPRMSAELADVVQRCSTCQEAQPALPKEPMMTYPIPRHPWECVSSDCFEHLGTNYVILVDTYSDYIEVAKLPNLTSESLINRIKPMFATHGIPTMLLTDNASYYTSSEFSNFLRDWDIQHVTSSPHHHKSNGKAESAVKIVKGILKKALQSQRDFYKALLEWRNTVTPGGRSSPAQRLMSRRTRSFVPCKSTELIPRVIENVPEQVKTKRKLAAKHHDKSAKSLPQLVVGQPVRAKTHPAVQNSSWKSAVVKAQVAPRSYVVDCNGKQYRRNRVHLRDSVEFVRDPGSDAEEPIACDNVDSPSAPSEPPVRQNVPLETPAPEPRRSARVRKVPAKFKDYAL